MPGTIFRFDRKRLFSPLSWQQPGDPEWLPLVAREWLVPNGIGGYASGTISGAATRRYHGLLIASLPPPLGRLVTLADLIERIELPDGRAFRLGGEARPETLELHGARWLTEFRLEWGLPVWTYDFDGTVLEKRLAMPHGKNAVVVEYRAAAPMLLELRPAVRFRPHDTPVNTPLQEGYAAAPAGGDAVRVPCPGGGPELHLRAFGSRVVFRDDPRLIAEVQYRVEASRGYAAIGDTWSPGAFTASIGDGDGTEGVALAAATDEPPPVPDGVWNGEVARRRALVAAAHPALHEGPGAVLALAADSFLITPPRAQATERTVLAGYHWFTDWGRDTMISLEGLALDTGRERDAAGILRTFGKHVRDGLVPNLFPEGGREGLYHTADASLWFVHALDRYVERTGDRDTLRALLPAVREILDRHDAGTRFGIGADPADGLLRQGEEGRALTWMDAKVGDWVVTPRRGKAVEINALWYNALRVAERWEHDGGDPTLAHALAARADRVRESFHARFWNDAAGCLYDVVDGENGDDAALRPNQILAVSLPNPVLRPDRWRQVVEAVERALWTPVGLRTLARDHPDYRQKYFGDLWARDAAYHQGTVWAWLVGPFLDAWLKLHPGQHAQARERLAGLVRHLDEFGLGSIAEIFDAEPPHEPRGCISQAWSVAEALRLWVKTHDGR